MRNDCAVFLISGDGNTAVGRRSFLYNKNGNYNSGLGTSVFDSDTSGNYNTGMGTYCFFNHMNGNGNTGIGYNAGFNNIVGAYNIFIGYGAGYNEIGGYKFELGSMQGKKYLWGDMASNHFGINADVKIKIVPTTYSPPTYILTYGVDSVVSKYAYIQPTSVDSIPFERNPSGCRIFLRNPNDKTGLGTSTPVEKLEINGSLKVDSCAYFALKDNGNSGTTLNINWKAGNIQKITRTGNCTINMIPPPGATRLTLLINHENSSVPYVLNFSPAPKWPGGVIPTFTNTSGSVDIVTFIYDGIAYYGSIENDYK